MIAFAVLLLACRCCFPREREWFSILIWSSTMATFITTTLTKRTGAGTTVFNPGITAGNSAVLFESSALAGYGASLQIGASRSSNMRTTTVLLKVPQLSDDGLSVLRFAQMKIELKVPDGFSQTAVNDIVGYAEACCSTAITNLDDLLVEGEGVY